VLRELEALDAFRARHFADSGTFLGGYAKLRNLDDLAGKLEHDLRGCVQRPSDSAPARLSCTACPLKLDLYN
jgi:hypothetical protein